MTHHSHDEEILLLGSRINALEQLLEVYEQAVLEQSSRLAEAHAALAKRVEELARSNEELENLNRALNREMAERKQAEESLQRSERLASIGTLAAGLAHEINNPLGLIVLEVNHALRAAQDPDEVRASLEEINGHVTRCARIVKSVLQFAREEETERSPDSVNRAAERARDLLRQTAKQHEVAVVLDLEAELPLVLMNSTEIEQVMVNLIHNAIQACSSGGTVAVCTRQGENTVRIIVRDDGQGMAESERQHAFDPFFTTRTRQGGTGLGLSICHGIIAKMGGTIALESASGRGTAVIVDLPRSG